MVAGPAVWPAPPHALARLRRPQHRALGAVGTLWRTPSDAQSGRNVNFVGGSGGVLTKNIFTRRPRRRVVGPDPVRPVRAGGLRSWARLFESQPSPVVIASRPPRGRCVAACAQIGGGASRIPTSPNSFRWGHDACALVHSWYQVRFEPPMAAWLGEGAVCNT